MTDRFDNMSLEDLLAALRADGWAVAVHNDYIFKPPPEWRREDLKMTFWLFTHPMGVFVKGEAPTDREAVMMCAIATRGLYND
jgi:hypothetical protein